MGRKTGRGQCVGNGALGKATLGRDGAEVRATKHFLCFSGHRLCACSFSCSTSDQLAEWMWYSQNLCKVYITIFHRGRSWCSGSRGHSLKLPQQVRAKIWSSVAQKTIPSASCSQPHPYAMLFYKVTGLCAGFPSCLPGAFPPPPCC